MATVVCVVLLVFQFLLLLRMVLSFFPISSDSPASGVRDLSAAITDPVVVPLRRSLPPLPGMLAGFGLAEILTLIAIQLLVQIIC